MRGRALKPGGWLEFQAIAPSSLVDQGATSPPPDSAALLWEETVIETYKIVCPEADVFRMGTLKAVLYVPLSPPPSQIRLPGLPHTH